MDIQKLPPLPRSDPQSLEQNRIDSYYQIKPREFYQDGELIREELKPFTKCQHFFEATLTGTECRICHVGYFGPIEISNGQLVPPGESLPGTNHLEI